MAIKNIVLDFGNVLIRWDPLAILKETFPGREDYHALVQDIFKHPTWFNHNRGHLSRQEIIEEYHARLGIDKNHLQQMMVIAEASLTPIEGSFDLLKSLHQLNFNLYGLTDNTKEFMVYIKQKYDFWNFFQGIVVSAEVGWLKPSPEIFIYLLDTYQLKAHETLFIDDYLSNVQGAQAVGIHAIQFENIDQCIRDLKKMEIIP